MFTSKSHSLYPEDGGSMVPWNFGILSHHHMVSQPRWPWLESSLPWKPQILPLFVRLNCVVVLISWSASIRIQYSWRAWKGLTISKNLCAMYIASVICNLFHLNLQEQYSNSCTWLTFYMLFLHAKFPFVKSFRYIYIWWPHIVCDFYCGQAHPLLLMIWVYELLSAT